MKRILITGGAGFIGANAVEYFTRSRDYHVVGVVDKLTYAADPARVEKYKVPLYCWDISSINREAWLSMLKKSAPEVVINFAAESHVDRSIEVYKSSNFIKSNYAGTCYLVNTLREFQKNYKSKVFFVQISTDEVLGDTDFDSTVEFTEDQPMNPSNLYAATKAAAELLVQSMHRTYRDFDYAIVRATNNYGPNQHFEKFLPTVIKAIFNKRKVPVYGKGENIREWLYTEDFIKGIDYLISTYYETPDKVTKEVFHFGSGVRKKNLDVVNELVKIIGIPAEVEFVPDRPGHDRRYALDYSKAQALLGWMPRMDFSSGLKIVVDDIKTRMGVL